MNNNYIERNKLLKNIVIGIIALIVIVSIVFYAVYIFSYHEYCYSESELFVALDENGLMVPSCNEEDINPETGMAEVEYESETNPGIEKGVLTIKGELSKGSFRYVLYNEEDDVVLDVTFEAGTYYNETYELENIGSKYIEFFEYEPETLAKGEGIIMTLSGMAKGYSLEFGSDD